ncbi:hypothetical protein P245_15290 [Comamonas thiooxydans]|uniref:Uncharacterized protein n=1 Tax=Comamonas thiooxydans TaxID=363952 RepID=A0A0E3BEK5_9BURK|nr:hypothetical protein [Comamonas thiooxydans]KGG90828.1 hypothetical protein P245_15290 [Comamonas thiooxydans]
MDAVVNIAGFMLLAAVVASPVACTMNRHALIIEAVKAGADPIAVRCAVESDMGQSAMCIAKALQRPGEVSNASAP